jgi:hypothetical protein
MKYLVNDFSKLVKIVGLVLMVVFLTTNVNAADELVLHLTFDELRGDVAEDISEFGNDATFNGNHKLVNGKFGMAIDLDGASWGEIPDDNSLDIVDGITIEMWAKLRAAGAEQTGVEKGTTWKAGLYTLAPYYRNGSILQFFDLPENCNDENIGGNIQDDTWHFMAGTWDGSTIKLYIDGELNKELECKGKLTANNEPLFIGARGGNQRFVNGALDEIKMYNYALTEDELIRDMENPNAADVVPQDKLTTTWARIKTR